MDRNRHGGGVCVYIKSNLYAERCVDFEDCRLECIWLKVRSINITFYFACVYRPPNSGNDFWQLLCDSVERVNPTIFICGDLNIDLCKPQSKIHDFMSICNLSQIISEPTRITSNTLIDVILTNAPRTVIHHGVLCSDHKPNFTCINSVRQAPSV